MKLFLAAALVMAVAVFALGSSLGCDMSLQAILEFLANALEGIVNFFAKLLEGSLP